MAAKTPVKHDDQRIPRGRGRPRAFDEAELIRQAQRLFWEAGYAATSLGDVVARTGVHKPSLYAAFTNKHGLFLKTLDLYFQDTHPLMDRAFGAETLRSAVQMFLTSDIGVFSADQGLGGCYFINVFAEAGRNDPALRDIAQKGWSNLRRRIDGRVGKAHEREVPPGWTRPATADLIMSSHVFLAVRGRARAPRSELGAYVARTVGCFPDI